MVNFITKDGRFIPPHLDHTLKSYYNSTGYSVFAYNADGERMNYAAKKEHCYHLPLVDYMAKKTLTKLPPEAYNTTDTHLIELYTDIFVLGAPVYVKGALNCFLMTVPFFIDPLSSAQRQAMHRALSDDDKVQLPYQMLLSLPSIDKDRLSYLGQLFHHLMANSIYIGQQHFTPQKKMTDTPWGAVLPQDSFKFSHCITNVPVIEKIAAALMAGALEEALHIYANANIFKKIPDEGQRPIQMLKYHYVAYFTLLQYLLADGYKALSAQLHDLTNEAVIGLESCYSYSPLFNYGEVIIRRFGQLILEHDQKSLSRHVLAAVNHIHKHYDQPLTLAEVAALIPINDAYLSSQFKQEMGKPFKQYLCDYRILKAKQRLESTNTPISDIALSVGFTNTNYFSTVFKKVVGVTPSTYIKNPSA